MLPTFLKATKKLIPAALEIATLRTGVKPIPQKRMKEKRTKDEIFCEWLVSCAGAFFSLTNDAKYNFYVFKGCAL